MYTLDKEKQKFFKKEVKTRTVGFRVTDADYALLEKMSKAYELTMSDLLGQITHLFLEKTDQDELAAIERDKDPNRFGKSENYNGY